MLQCLSCVHTMFGKSKNHNIRQIFKGKIWSFFFFFISISYIQIHFLLKWNRNGMIREHYFTLNAVLLLIIVSACLLHTDISLLEYSKTGCFSLPSADMNVTSHNCIEFINMPLKPVYSFALMCISSLTLLVFFFMFVTLTFYGKIRTHSLLFPVTSFIVVFPYWLPLLLFHIVEDQNAVLRMSRDITRRQLSEKNKQTRQHRFQSHKVSPLSDSNRYQFSV